MQTFTQDKLKVFYITVAIPILALGLYFLISGCYQLTWYAIRPSVVNESAESAVWDFMFSFGATSIATLIASRADFLSKPTIRNIFYYSQCAASVLFLGYLSIGVVAWLSNISG